MLFFLFIFLEKKKPNPTVGANYWSTSTIIMIFAFTQLIEGEETNKTHTFIAFAEQQRFLLLCNARYDICNDLSNKKICDVLKLTILFILQKF